MILQAIRSAFFYVWLFVVTAILATIVTIFSLFKPTAEPVSKACASFWMWMMRGGLRWIVGIRFVISGRENIPDGPALVASKHQSDMDIISIYPEFNFPSFIAKKQLFDIPLFGQALRVLKTIEIDRSAGSRGMIEMIRQARDFVHKGQSIMIFPEGTRKAPLADPNYKFGVVKMYQDLDIPILPIALNTGLYWGRNSLILWPGTARIEILPPIAPGLSNDDVFAKLQDVVESRSTQLTLEAIDAHITRPINDDLRQRAQRARQNNAEA